MRWIRTPRWIGEACASLPRIGAHCPGIIPLARAPGTIAEAAHDRSTGPGRVEDELGVQWGGESPGHPARNHPPGFLHFEVSAGDVGGLRRFDHAATVPAAGIMRGRSFFTSAPVSFGSREWGTHDGVLVLGDCWGNHLCYRWRQGGQTRQVDLHGWEPFTQTVAVLRAMAEATP